MPGIHLKVYLEMEPGNWSPETSPATIDTLLRRHLLLFERELLVVSTPQFKGAPPNAADPGGFPDFLIFSFFGKFRYGEFFYGIWGLGGFATDAKWLRDSN